MTATAKSSLSPVSDRQAISIPYTPQPSAELAIDKFDDLLTELSKAILNFIQHYATGDATELNFAVFRAKEDVRDEYAAVIERLHDAAHHSSECKENDARPDTLDQIIAAELEKQKSDADRLRLSLHEQSEMMTGAIRERDEALEKLLGQEDTIQQLIESKRMNGENQAEKRILYHEVTRLKTVTDHALAMSRDATSKKDNALWEAQSATRMKNTAMDVVAKMKQERDAANKERDVAMEEKGVVLARLEELERLEHARIRQQAFEALSTKLGEKKRKVSADVGISGSKLQT